MKSKFLFICGTFLLFPFILNAVENESVRKSALLIATLREETKDTLLEEILESELKDLLRESRIDVQENRLELPEGDDLPKLPDEERISRLLSRVDSADADIIVAAFYLAEGDELTIQFALYDPAVKVVLGGVLTRARKGLTVFSSLSAAVEEFEPAVKRYMDGRYVYDPPKGLVERITVSGPQEGAKVILVDRDYGQIAGGGLTIPYTQYTIDSIVPLVVMKEGYHTYSENVTLDDIQVNITIPPLYPETRIDADIRWSYGLATGVGLGVRFHLVPDSLFIGIEGYRTFDAGTLSSNLVRHYDINLHLGRYIVFPYSSFFRIHLALGVGMVITDVEGGTGRDYTDFYIVLGDPTAEFTLGPVKLFVRPELHYALGLGYNLLGCIWIKTPDGLPPLTVGARWSW